MRAAETVACRLSAAKAAASDARRLRLTAWPADRLAMTHVVVVVRLNSLAEFAGEFARRNS